ASSDPHAAAAEVYRLFLQNTPANNEDDFEGLCVAHPDLADQLRRLHSVARLAQSLAGSVAFRHALREVFGEEPQVKLRLDEADVDAEDEKVTLVEESASRPS